MSHIIFPSISWFNSHCTWHWSNASDTHALLNFSCHLKVIFNISWGKNWFIYPVDWLLPISENISSAHTMLCLVVIFIQSIPQQWSWNNEELREWEPKILNTGNEKFFCECMENKLNFSWCIYIKLIIKLSSIPLNLRRLKKF